MAKFALALLVLVAVYAAEGKTCLLHNILQMYTVIDLVIF